MTLRKQINIYEYHDHIMIYQLKVNKSAWYICEMFTIALFLMNGNKKFTSGETGD
jgi:hypothetical protein